MIKHLPVLALSFIAASALVIDDFEVFKTEYSKRYLNEEEEAYRKSVFLTTKKYIEDHNSDPSNTYTLKINEFADIETQEFFEARRGLLQNANNIRSKSSRTFSAPADLTLPESVDWRNLTGDVKNQGRCGSCWAFSTTGSLEGQYALKYGKPVSLSEQQLVDCSRYFNLGCRGGLVDFAFKYVCKVGGLDTESNYPYTGMNNQKCRFNKSSIGANCTGFVSIESGRCTDLKKAVASVGPISVYMDASQHSFAWYGTGIYSSRNCSSTYFDHAVLVVGYGTDNGTDYWLVKNSWGKSWGMDGYFKIASENGMCGICEYGYYPTV